MLSRLELPDCYFWAQHAVKLDGVLRSRKQWMLEKLSWSIAHMRENPISRTSRIGT